MANETRQEKNETLLDAALEAYARYGIHSATTKHIAEIAGIGKSTIFEYYRSSEELMHAAFSRYISIAEIGRKALRDMANSDAAEALVKYFNSLTKMITREPDKLLLLSQYVTEILSSGKDFAEVKRHYAEKLQPSADSLLEDFRSIVEAGVNNRVFKPVGNLDSSDCALLLSAIAREMQAQAFVQDEENVNNTCLRLKRIALRMLGAANSCIYVEE